MRQPEEPNEYANFLRELIDGGHLDDPALGITKLVIDKGDQALSQKQAFVFQRDVTAEYVREECTSCGNGIPWSEMYAAHDNGGRCNWCEHMERKRGD